MNSIKNLVLTLAAPLALAALCATAAAQPCTPHWETPATVMYSVNAFCVFDDGGGPALYVAGQIVMINGVEVSRIAKWDGQAWSRVGNGLHGPVDALAVFDDGTGPALYAGGSFSELYEGPGNHVAKWNGTSWVPLGTGMNGLVRTVAVFDDGTGPALYAGGYFTTAGSATANHIAKWNGQTWSAVGSPTAFTPTADIYALSVFNDGSGPALFVGGYFSSAGGQPAHGIVKWNGQSWVPVGAGLGIAGSACSSLAVFDDGGGPALYAGGGFNVYYGGPGDGIAKWNGSYWSPLGSGVNNGVNPDNNLLIHGVVNALTAYDDGDGPALFAGGDFTFAGSAPANRAAKWDGSAWSALGDGVQSFVYALFGYDDGSGPALYVGAYDATPDPPGPDGPLPAPPLVRWRACPAGAGLCCRGDYNGDGDTGTDADIEAFFACLAGNCCPTCPPDADFDCNGDAGTDADIESFFRVLAGGPC